MPEIKKISYTHDAMVDMILARPTISGNELAVIFDRTPAWISIIRASDAFQARLAARRTEVVDPMIQEEIEARFKLVTQRSLEVIQEKLAAPSVAVDPVFALKAAELGMKGMGIGQPRPDAGNGSQEDRLSRLAERLTGLLGSVPRATEPLPAVEVVPREVG